MGSRFSRKVCEDGALRMKLIDIDVLNIPRWWAESTVSSNIVFWKEHKQGGHFASVECPVDLVEDIREFTTLVNPDRMSGLVKSGKLKK